MKRILWIINYYVKKIRLVWTVILLAILIVFLMTGCKTETVLVPVDRVKVEYKDRLRIDSVYNRDTIQIYKKNDTIYYEKIKWRERFKIDTVSVVRVDSIPYPVEVVREINKLTKWQRLRLNALNIIAIIIVCYVVIKIRTL